MGGSSKKGSDDNDIPQINPQQLIDQAIAANRVNVSTPFGSQTYNGNTLTTALSPEMQALFAQQMARAGGPANSYQLPGQSASILNGLNTRLDQRYGIAPPPAPAGGSGSAAGTAGGSVPAIPPSTPPSAPPLSNSAPGASPPQQPIPRPGQDNQPPNEFPSDDPDWLPPRQAAAGAHYGQEYTGGMCVVADSWLPGNVRAAEAVMGHAYPAHLPESGFHAWPLQYRGDLVKQPCVRLTVKGGATLRVSASTPFTFPDATRDLQDGKWAYAPDMLGQSVFVLTPAGHEARVVELVEDIGEQLVVPLSFGGRSFAAGDCLDALIYSHNIVKDSYANVNGAVYGFGDTGMSGANPLSGAIDQSHMAAANFGFGPMAPEMNTLSGNGPTSVDKGSKTDASKSGATTAASSAASSSSIMPPLQSMPSLPMPQYPHHSFLDSRYAKLAAALLGGAPAALGLGALNKFRHRHDDDEKK